MKLILKKPTNYPLNKLLFLHLYQLQHNLYLLIQLILNEIKWVTIFYYFFYYFFIIFFIFYVLYFLNLLEIYYVFILILFIIACPCGTKTQMNLSCTNQLCQSCCVDDPRYCSVSKHSFGKVAKYRKNTVDLIQRSIDENFAIFIRYESGTTPGKVRPVRVIRWDKEPVSFKAICGRSNQEQKYIVWNISEARVSDFQ